MRIAAFILAMALTAPAWAQPAPPDAPPPGAMQPAPPPEAMQPAPPPGAMQPGPPPAPGMAPQHMRMRDRFAAANTTHDGRLTLEQAQAANMRPVVRHFQQIDKDHKGYITLQDLADWHRAMRAEKAAEHAQPPGAPPAPPPPPAAPGGQPY